MKQLPKKLYHVSLHLNHPGIFDLRVPESRMKDEDSVTPRICVSDSIEGCLTASAFGAHYLGESLMETDDLMKVFVIDTEKLGLTSSDVIFPTELYQSGKVDDANLTNEYWILKDFVVPQEDQLVVKVTGFDDGDWEPFWSYEERQYMDSLDIDRSDYEVVEEAYYEKYQTEFPSFCIIKDVTFDIVSNELASA